MILNTRNVITVLKIDSRLYSITLDINNQRVYWLDYGENVIFSSDYHGKNKKINETRRPLYRYTLDVSDRSIFLMDNVEARILMVNETEKDVFRNFTIENSDYYKLIVCNRANHATGKS